MSKLFYQKINFNEDISRWDVSNVTDMSDMFFEATSFNQSLDDWNVSDVKDMRFINEIILYLDEISLVIKNL